MDVVLRRLAEEEQQRDVLGHLPRKRERRRHFELGDAEDHGVGVAGGAFDGDEEDGVEEREDQVRGDCAGVAGREAGAAAVLDGLGDAGEGDVEEEREERGEEPEDDAEGEDADKVHAERRMREDERCPGHVEEHDVEGGGP